MTFGTVVGVRGGWGGVGGTGEGRKTREEWGPVRDRVEAWEEERYTFGDGRDSGRRPGDIDGSCSGRPRAGATWERSGRETRVGASRRGRREESPDVGGRSEPGLRSLREGVSGQRVDGWESGGLTGAPTIPGSGTDAADRQCRYGSTYVRHRRST